MPPMTKKAAKAALKKSGRSVPSWAKGTSLDPNADAVVDNPLSPDAPETTYPQNATVEITRGDALEDTVGQDGSPGGDRTVGGVKCRVDGQPYVARGGPNRGEVIQTVKEIGTGRLYGVPTSKLKSVGGDQGHSAARVGWSPGWDAAWEKAFGKKKGR